MEIGWFDNFPWTGKMDAMTKPVYIRKVCVWLSNPFLKNRPAGIGKTGWLTHRNRHNFNCGNHHQRWPIKIGICTFMRITCII
jgi:hypothetical protein